MALSRRSFTVTLTGAAFAQRPPAFTPPPGARHEPGLLYSKVRDGLMLDIVRPSGQNTPLPAVVLVHGGGFRRGTRQSQLPFAAKLAQRGYVAAAVSYGLAPQHPFPAAVHDTKEGVRFLRANAERLQILPDRIGAMGASAGGHLVLMLGLTAGVAEFEGSGAHRNHSSRVLCVVNYYGPTDLTKSCGKSVDACEVLPLFLGGTASEARPVYIRASPLNWVTPLASPVLTLHGTEDRYVNYEHAVWITERLQSAGVPTELVIFPGADHGFKGKDAEGAEQKTFAWFDRWLK